MKILLPKWFALALIIIVTSVAIILGAKLLRPGIRLLEPELPISR
jgi:hypothetical protein